jgi:hypothetical protein
LALVWSVRKPGAAPVDDWERSASVSAEDVPRLHLDPAEATFRECASLAVADGVRVPDLDQQKHAAGTGGAHGDVRDVTAAGDAYRLFTVNSDWRASG